MRIIFCWLLPQNPGSPERVVFAVPVPDHCDIPVYSRELLKYMYLACASICKISICSGRCLFPGRPLAAPPLDFRVSGSQHLKKKLLLRSSAEGKWLPLKVLPRCVVSFFSPWPGLRRLSLKMLLRVCVLFEDSYSCSPAVFFFCAGLFGWSCTWDKSSRWAFVLVIILVLNLFVCSRVYLPVRLPVVAQPVHTGIWLCAYVLCLNRLWRQFWNWHLGLILRSSWGFLKDQ